MRIGIPTETKKDEYRVGLTPAGARELSLRGHEIFVQGGAGEGSAIADADYTREGAQILPDAASVFAEADLIVKVKEPQPDECELLEPRHTLCAYLHLAPDPRLTQSLVDSGATCIAYETVADYLGRLPLLAPMSEVAGKVATQAGAFMLMRPLGGRGVLLGGVSGVPPGRVVIIGGGVVGQNAAQVAVGLGAEVTILDSSIERLRELDGVFDGRAATCYASALAIEQHIVEADLIVGAVLVRGGKAPRILRREQLAALKRRAVLVDVSIDQGGCFETSRPTSHSDPSYEMDGIMHYCVTNMPGAVPSTSTRALTNATTPYVLELADRGVSAALENNPGFAAGLNIVSGVITNEAVGRDQERNWTSAETAIARAYHDRA